MVPSGMSWHDMEVVGGGKQPPQLVLRGRAADVLRERGIVHMHLTLTHTVGVAAAVVIAEGPDRRAG